MNRALIAALTAIAWTMIPPSQALAENVATAWGFNGDGELGNGATTSTGMPSDVSLPDGVVSAAGGGHHSLFLLEGGSVMASGENFYGQLGDGTTESSDAPVPVTGLREVVAVAAGAHHSLALLRNGTVMAWGHGASGQLGIGSDENRSVPTAVEGLSGVSKISAGGNSSLALLADGTVMAWGENLYGQLGDGTRESSSAPVAVSGLSGAVAISAGVYHDLALLSNGTVMAWGDNELGELGDGSEVARDTPVPVTELRDATGVAAGVQQSLAIVSGGAVVAWGGNETGQLGIGNDTGPELCGSPQVFACSRRPVRVSGLETVTAVSSGSHNLALLSDGAVVAWGPNGVGQLGDGSMMGPEVCAPSATPCSTVPIASLTHVGALGISTGEEFSLAFGTRSSEPLPELGRCVRVAEGGAYSGTAPRCVALSSTHTGHFEWLPGPGTKATFKENLKEPLLETIGKARLVCATATLEGAYLGSKAERISNLRLGGCRDAGTSSSCQSGPSEEGVINSSVPFEGTLGLITAGERPRVGWELRPRPPSTTFASFECGVGTDAVLMSLKGSVIARVTPVDQMVSTFELRYGQTSGRQAPEAFEGGIRQVLTLASTPLTGSPTFEQTGLSSRGSEAGEEALELKVKP